MPQELADEISKAGEPLLTEVGEREVAAVAFGPNSSPEEIVAARAELVSRGLDPDYVDGMNQRRDLDNPLSAGQAYDQMVLNKQRQSSEDSSL
jgi:hypothetical protein